MGHGNTSKIILTSIAAVVVIVLLSLGQYRSISSGLSPIREAFFVFEKVVTAPFHFAHNIWTDYIFLVGTRSENKEIRNALDQARVQCMVAQELKSENERLRAMLDFKSEHSDFQLFPAQLLSQDITNVFKTVVIDRGRTSGFFADMPVVSPQGLMGRVISVSPHTSQVLLITDPISAVPVIIEESRVKGIVKGMGANMLSLEYVRNTELVQVGSMVVTSGMEGFFPKGLRVGRIAGIWRDPNKIFIRIMVRPCVEMSKIEGLFGVGFHAANAN